MPPRLVPLACLALLHAPAPSARADAIIDAWQAPQQLATPPAMVGQVVSGPGIIGGFRASGLLADGTSASTLSIGNGTLTFTVDPAATRDAFLDVTWDGPPPGTGLGGVDVTDGGTATGFRLDVIGVEGGPVRYALVVADTTPRVGNVLGVIPGGTQNLSLFFPFSLFVADSEPVLIDMTRVAKIQVQFEVPPGGRVVLGLLETPGAAAVPEPAGVCLWVLAGVAGAAWVCRRAAA